MTEPTPFDRRRSRWIAYDVFFFANDFGAEMLERFGPAGVTVFLAFLLACKRNHIEGQFAYQNDADALSQLGLTGLALVDQEGEPWDLDAFWTFTGQHKVTRRRARGRVQHVLATRWERWQHKAKSQQGHKHPPTSDPENSDGKQTDSGEIEDDSGARQDTYRDTDNTPPTPPDESGEAAPPEGGGGMLDLVAQRVLNQRRANGENIKSVSGFLQWYRDENAAMVAEQEAALRQHYVLSDVQIADVIASGTRPQWLAHCRRGA